MSEAATRATTAQTAPSIAYRDDDGDLATSATHVLLVTALLLGAVLALLVLAQRRGWLQRWTGGSLPTIAAPTAAAGLRVEQRLRLSPRTLLFRVADGERRYLVVESTGGVQLVVDPAAEHVDHG